MDSKSMLYKSLTENRMCIFGIASLWIFFRHAYLFSHFSFAFGVFDYIIQIGDIGVDIFMFLSAYGLSYSYKKNRSVYIFYRRRLLRILPSTLLLLLCLAVIDSCVYGKSVWQCISLRYWFMSLYSTYWFVGAILVFYFAFPFLYEFLVKCKEKQVWMVLCSFIITILLIIVIQTSEVTILQQLKLNVARIPILIIGILWAARGIWWKSTVCVLFLTSVPLVYLLPKDYQRISYSFVTLGLIYYFPLMIGRIPDFFKKALAIVGCCSLEFYIIHFYFLYNNTLQYVDSYVHLQVISCLIVLCIVILLSWMSNNIVESVKRGIKW